nr:transposase [Streptomyces sp. 840.1]
MRGTPFASPPVHLPERRVPAPHVRRADTRPDPKAQSADRAAALDPGRDRARPRRSGRRPPGRHRRRSGQPQHGPAAGRRTSRAGGTRSTGGRCRRIRHAQGPPLRHRPRERRNPPADRPDRESSSLAAWLAQRPGIEVVCRDRAPFFAEGATVGAPQAVQVADRWHLWHNPSEAAERSIAQHRQCLRVLVPEMPEPPKTEPGPAEKPSGSPWPTGHRFADRTRTVHATVHALVKAGHSRRAIQRQ